MIAFYRVEEKWPREDKDYDQISIACYHVEEKMAPRRWELLLMITNYSLRFSEPNPVFPPKISNRVFTPKILQMSNTEDRPRLRAEDFKPRVHRFKK